MKIVKLEVTSAMPIGYQRGNTYHMHLDGDVWMELPIFKSLTSYAMARKFGTHISWSHITRAYDVELREIVYFKSSGQPYMMSRANRGGKNPLEALVSVLRETLPLTPLLSAMLLEAECVLLSRAYDKAVDIGERVEKLCDDLASVLESAWRVFLQETVLDLHIRELPRLFPGVKITTAPKPIPAATDEDDDL